jgi:hypothetical protein
VAEEMRRERRTAEGGEDEKDDENGASERELVPAQTQPDALPVTAGADGPNIALGGSYLCLLDEIVDVDGGRKAPALVEVARHRIKEHTRNAKSVATLLRVSTSTTDLPPKRKNLSARAERYLPWLAALILVVGVAAAIVKFAPGTNPARQVIPKTTPAPVKPKTVKLSPAAASVIFKFVKTAVARQDLAAAWKLSGPAIRGGLTYKEWLTGNIPVVPYPIETRHFAPRIKVDYSYANDTQLELALLPKAGSGVKPQFFIAELKRIAGADGKKRWVVVNWVPRTALAVPKSPEGG